MFSFFNARRAKYIITVLTERRVENVRSVRKLKSGKVIICERRTTLSAVFNSQRCRIGHIDTVDIFWAKISVTWVFYIFCIETHKSVLSVFNLISITIFTINRMHVSDELFFSERFQVCQYFERASMEERLTPEFFKCLLRNRLIKYMIFFILESIASDTVMTVITLFDAETVTTIHWIFRIHTIIASSEIHPIIDELTFVTKSWINHIFYVSDEIGVEDFFAIGRTNTQVTILGSEGKICVVRIDTLDVVEGEFWCDCEEVCILIKETSLKIKSSSVTSWIPIISPPDFLIVDWIGFVWGVDGYNFFAGKITFSFIHFSLISPGKSSSLPLFWRECWRW